MTLRTLSSTPISPGWQECARTGCVIRFKPKTERHKYCSPRCRILAFRERLVLAAKDEEREAFVAYILSIGRTLGSPQDESLDELYHWVEDRLGRLYS